MLRKACISIAAAAMVITGSVSAANAIQVDAGGGRWDYGTGWTNVWSNYYHQGLWHGSSVVGNYNSDSGCKAPNSWSYASAQKSWYNTGRSYYRHC